MSGLGRVQQVLPRSSSTSPAVPDRKAAGGRSRHGRPAQGSGNVVGVVELVEVDVVELDVVELDVVDELLVVVVWARAVVDKPHVRRATRSPTVRLCNMSASR
jgi:hypothetical protein